MKASGLVTKLQELIERHGDHNVESVAEWGMEIEDVLFEPEYSGGIGIFQLVDGWVNACEVCRGEGQRSVPVFPGAETVAKATCRACDGTGKHG